MRDRQPDRQADCLIVKAILNKIPPASSVVEPLDLVPRLSPRVHRLAPPLPLHAMGKKSRKKPPAPLPLPCDRCAKRVPATVARRCPKCELVVYCSKECQRAAWSGGHKVQCQVMKRAAILKKAGRESLMYAALEGDMAAMRALMEAGADAEEADKEQDCTPVMGAACGGWMEVFVYLVETCSANLRQHGFATRDAVSPAASAAYTAYTAHHAARCNPPRPRPRRSGRVGSGQPRTAQ